MTPELDAPTPQVLRSSPWRTGGVLAIFVCFTAIGAAMSATQAGIGWLALAFGLVGTAVSAFMLVRPNRLELTASGLATVTLGRRWSATWAECGEFRTWKFDGEPGTTARVIFDCSAPGVRGHALEVVAIAISGENAGLPDTYGMRASDLAALLNRFRETYAGDRPVTS